MNLNNLNIKIFADGADKNGMLDMYSKEHIKGLTTNPTLMKKAGITDYSIFCKDILLFWVHLYAHSPLNTSLRSFFFASFVY